MELKHFSSGFLTGYGFIFKIRKEFAKAESFANTEDIGSIDAPDLIACGSMISVGNGMCQQNFLRW